MRVNRMPATAEYDAVVGLEPVQRGRIPSFAYALVKMTYQVANGRAKAIECEPLALDLYGDEPLSPPVPSGSDFWVSKTATDVVVLGSAFAPAGRPTPSMEVLARVGPLSKRIAVFGRREIVWPGGGRIQVPHPEPFVEMPIVYTNAYGGLDPRVPIPEEGREEYMQYASIGLATDHPGLYPRNPAGKGYLVYPEPISGFEMPNLEDPDDLLTADRLATGSPELWYQQPLPWCFEWTNLLMYPRELYIGLDAWFPSRKLSSMQEFRRGFVSPRAVDVPEAGADSPPELYQEASLGMVAREPLAGLQVAISGMHPENPSLTFLVPRDPEIEIEIDGRRSAPRPLLTNLVIRPAEGKFYAVWCAQTADMPRKFVPELHKNIPLSVSVNRGAPIRYQSPPTVRERLLAATGTADGDGAAGQTPPGKSPF